MTIRDVELNANGVYAVPDDGISIPDMPRQAPAARLTNKIAQQNGLAGLGRQAAMLSTATVAILAGMAGVINYGMNQGPGPRYTMAQSTKIAIDAGFGTNLSAPASVPATRVEILKADPAGKAAAKSVVPKPASRI